MATRLCNILGRIISYSPDSGFKYETLGYASMDVSIGVPIAYKENGITKHTQDIITSIDIKNEGVFSPTILNKGKYIIKPEIRPFY